MDDDRIVVPGARDVRAVLAADPIYAVARTLITRPLSLGLILFALALAVLVFGPSTESRFIYTDF